MQHLDYPINFRIVYELCDILLLLLGAFTVRTPDLSNIQLEINQFIRIPIDCRLAGPGKLQVKPPYSVLSTQKCIVIVYFVPEG